jgi:hypothetical protein
VTAGDARFQMQRNIDRLSRKLSMACQPCRPMGITHPRQPNCAVAFELVVLWCKITQSHARLFEPTIVWVRGSHGASVKATSNKYCVIQSTSPP